jgi:heat shock protein HslJ
MTGPDCSDPAALTLEGRYTDALQSATNYRLAEGRLELLTTREGVLIFETLP